MTDMLARSRRRLARRSLLLVAGCATLAVPATGQQTLTFYEHASFGGASLQFALPPSPGTVISLGSSWGDRITSLRWNLQPGTVVTFYEHSNGTGREYAITHAQSRVGSDSNVGSYYNDKFSSFRWHRVVPADGWFRMWTNAKRGGYQLTRYVSDVGLSTVRLIPLGYNDQIDSLEWDLPRDRTVMMHDEDPVGGRALPLINRGYVDDLSTRFSGLHHDNLSTAVVMDGQYTAAWADRDAPLDQVCQLDAHNAHVSSAQGWIFWYNQTMTVVEQLDYGARRMSLDVREQNGVLYLTHGSWSQSLAARGGVTPEPLGQVMGQIDGWLRRNPSEVLWITFENYAGSALVDWIDNSPLAPLLYVPDDLHWPSINELVAMNRRLIVAHDLPGGNHLDKVAWRVGNDFSSFGSTTARWNSDPIDSAHKSIFLMSHISGTSTPLTWAISGGSPNDVGTLYGLALQFSQSPTWVSIDGIQMADHGGLEACRLINKLMWQLRSPHRATSYEFHPPCTTGTNSEITTIDRPILGLTYRVSAAPSDVMVLGTDDRFVFGIPLPLTLPGVASCQLRIEPLIGVPIPANGEFALPIPKSSSLVGLDLFLQSVRVFNNSVYTSNGLVAHLGII